MKLTFALILALQGKSYFLKIVLLCITTGQKKDVLEQKAC